MIEIETWNKLIGFEQIMETEVSETKESVIDWLTNHVQGIVIIPRNQNVSMDVKEPNEFYFYHHYDSWIGISHDVIVIDGIITNHLDSQKGLEGWKIVFPVLSAKQFASKLENVVHQQLQLYFIEFENHMIALTVDSYQEAEIHIRMTTNDSRSRIGCLDWILKYDVVIPSLKLVEAELEALLLTKPEKCRGFFKGFGRWILHFMDTIHIALEIEKCTLVDASKFQGINATCLYSSKNNGLSWYNSHGYLLDTYNTVLDAVRATNESILSWFSFWNELDANRKLTHWICSQIPKEEVNMVKYYKENIVLHKPQTPWKPAFFTLDHININPQTTFAIRFDHAFMNIFRLQDCMSIMDVDEVKTKYIQFTNDDYKIMTEKEVQSIKDITTPLSYLIYDTKHTDWKRYFLELFPHLQTTEKKPLTCDQSKPDIKYIIVRTKEMELVGWKHQKEFLFVYPITDIIGVFAEKKQLCANQWHQTSPYTIRLL